MLAYVRSQVNPSPSNGGLQIHSNLSFSGPSLIQSAFGSQGGLIDRQGSDTSEGIRKYNSQDSNIRMKR